MGSELILFEDAQELYNRFWQKDLYFVHTLGLASTHEDGRWIESDLKKSYLKIDNKPKWVMSRLKYGI